MKRNKSKLNRYGKAVGIAVICGQVFREKPKRHRAGPEQPERGKETDGMLGTD